MEAAGVTSDRARSDDEIAIERYRYLLRTAPPETIEEAHAEAFARLSPDQRRQVIDGLAADVREAISASPDDPRGMARMATSAALRQPGILERGFGSTGGGFGLGGWFLTTMAASFIGTAAAQTFFADPGHGPGDASQAGYEDGAATDGSDDSGGGDFGGGDFGI